MNFHHKSRNHQNSGPGNQKAQGEKTITDRTETSRSSELYHRGIQKGRNARDCKLLPMTSCVAPALWKKEVNKRYSLDLDKTRNGLMCLLLVVLTYPTHLHVTSPSLAPTAHLHVTSPKMLVPKTHLKNHESKARYDLSPSRWCDSACARQLEASTNSTFTLGVSDATRPKRE